MPAIALVFGLLAIGALASEAAADPRFAVATTDEGGTGCVCTRGWRLQVGDSLLVAQFDPPEILDAVVSGTSDSCWAANQGVWGDSLSFYSTHILAPTEFGLGIATSARDASAFQEGGQIGFRFQPGGDAYMLHSCASMEGIHLSASHGRRQVWHEYYYLPYEVDPDCTWDEVGDITEETGTVPDAPWDPAPMISAIQSARSVDPVQLTGAIFPSDTTASLQGGYPIRRRGRPLNEAEVSMLIAIVRKAASESCGDPKGLMLEPGYAFEFDGAVPALDVLISADCDAWVFRRSTETLRNFNPSAHCVQPDLQRIVERVFGSARR